MLGVFGGEGADVVGGETEIPGIGGKGADVVGEETEIPGIEGGGGGAEPGIGGATPVGIAGGLLDIGDGAEKLLLLALLFIEEPETLCKCPFLGRVGIEGGGFLLEM